MIPGVHPALFHELHWFFHESAGEMGLRSNFMSFYNAMLQGPSSHGVAHEVGGRAMAAARRARSISRALDAAGEPHRTVLRQACAAARSPDVSVADLMLSGPVPRRAAARARHVESRAAAFAALVLALRVYGRERSARW